MENLTETGKETWKAALQLALVGHVKAGLFALGGIFDDKVKAGDMIKKYIDEMVIGVEHGLKALKAAGDTAGRATLHLGRWLFAK